MSSGVLNRVRHRFRGKRRTPANEPPGVGAASPMSAPVQTNDPSQDLLQVALQELSEDEKTTLREHLTSDVDSTIQATYNAAEKQKRACEERRWPGGDTANKVLLWLDRFKSVGDVVANVDPIHVGLPWAGIRMLLGAAVADINQMSALLNGMNLVLCFANRLQAYFVYFQRLPSALTTDNLRKALVALYSYVLKFLAIAIRTYTTDRALRKVQALWQTSDIQTFESQCDKLGGRADIAANNCDRELRAESRAAAAEWKKDLILTLEKLDNIQLVTRSVKVLQMKADLSKLIKVQEATYNSSAEEKLSVCLKGTRSQILHDIEQWIDQPDGKLIYWLCGKAGTGKSTISRTIAQRFVDKQCLGASFFFKRGEQNRSNATHFFSTIAAQLSDLLPHLRVPISAALDKDSMLCGRGLQEQFEKLVLFPVLSIDPADLPPQRVAIVIDALDECNRNTDIQMFLRLLAQVEAKSALRLRIFITSRPELPIQLGFRKLDSKFHQDIVLEEVQALTIGRDIRVYFNHEFAKIRQDRLLTRPNDALPVDWPSEEDMQMLVNLAVPLFIFASTVCRFVSESKPRERLRSILAQRTSEASQLAKTYAPILDQLLLEKDEEEQAEILTRFRKVVGPIILAADPLSVASLASLLGMSQDDIHDILDHLHSVLQIPSSSRDPVRLLHLSFRDFLIDPKRKDKDRFWINEAELHGQLAADCLRRLNELGTFKYDICCVVKPGTRRAQVTSEQIATSIPSDVAYACNYWPKHLIKSGIQLIDDKAEHKFLQEHLLHWLEALSWLGELWSAIYHINGLIPLAKGDDSNKLADFLQDAKRFVAQNRLPINLAPLQIYHSAMIFAPTQSIVRKTFCKQVPQLWTCLPRVAACWSAKIVKLNEHDCEVYALAFSPDGQVVASGSNDGTVRLWNAITGEQMQKLEGHVGVVHKVVFSPEGQVLASVSDDATVRLWNATTGEQTQKLEGHDSRINAVAFSPDGQVFASGSIDGTLWLWNAITGERMQKLEGHSGVVLKVVFSRDGQVIASGSHDAAVRLWNATTGKLTKKLEGHRHWILGVAFSPDGQAVASASADGTVRLWNATTGEQTQKLEGHGNSIGAVAFSSDGQTVASASLDGTVRVWNAITGEVIQLISDIRPVDQMTFSVDMRALQTNAGNYLLEAAVAGFPTDTSARTTSLELRGQWICDRGDDLLWLPYEFGALYSIMHGQALAIRQSSGDVSIFRLK